jgi:hypothetical protein
VHSCKNELTRARWARSACWAAIVCLTALVAAGCGGSGNTPPSNTTFPVGVTVNGVAGSGLVLQDNGRDDLGVRTDASYTFGTQLKVGQAYKVTVKIQPANPTQVCTVSGGTGTVTSNGVGTVNISCVTQAFAVGGTVQGLLGSGLSLQDNGGDDARSPLQAS